MAAFNLFHAFIADRNNGVHNMASDTLKVALTNVAPDAAADAVFSDISEIAPGNGYSSGGAELPVLSSAQVNGAYSLIPASDIVWTATGDMAAFRYAVLYNDSAASKNLIAYYDKGNQVSLKNGGTFTFDVGATIYTDSE